MLRRHSSETQEDEAYGLVPASPVMATLYRALTARAKYVSQERAEMQLAVNELCRNMSSPKKGDWKRLKRLARHLAGRPRAVHRYPWQEKLNEVEAFSDSDWAGCRISGKGTS